MYFSLSITFGKGKVNNKMETKQVVVQEAAYNTAVWCDSVCCTHQVPGVFFDAAWVNLHQTPLYYPNLVTLTPTAELDLQNESIAELLTTKKSYPVSVKDSFAQLDLHPFEFHCLFQAQ